MKEGKDIPEKKSLNKVMGTLLPQRNRDCIQSGKDRKQDVERWVVEVKYLKPLLPCKDLELYSVDSRKSAKFSMQGNDISRFKTQKHNSRSLG